MLNNFEKLYDLIEENQKELNSFYLLLDDNKDEKKEKILQKLLKASKLQDTKENRLALLSRLIGLREDNLIQALKQAKKSDKEIEKISFDVHEEVKIFHLKRQKKIIKQIKKEKLLSEFYMNILLFVYDIGEILSQIWIKWKKQIIFNINKKLSEKYGDNVYEFLAKNHLFEYFSDGTQADRSYSVLFEKKSSFKALPYIKAFKQMSKVVEKLDTLCQKLSTLQDKEFNQKEAYIEYFQALKNAFNEEKRSNLLNAWQDVDRAWMAITSPLQVGHPLEYYEDHLRKAVALEWDIRLDDVKKQKNTEVKNNILSMYKNLSLKLDKDMEVYKKCEANVQRVALHIGRPAFYFAAEFDGLFSAQVVPNDEEVSKQYGKKIFAFADNVYENTKAKPFLKIHSQIYEKDFLNESREILFKNEKLWHKIYEISTIGHEFGHILWLKSDSEMLMNKSGMFKNIEEFKATSGGLMAFFHHEKEELKRPLMIDLIKRSVGLIAWMKTAEVEAYYCEGLIHLSGLFESKVLDFKHKLNIDLGQEAYDRLKKWYEQNYEILAQSYLKQEDAKVFLSRFAIKENNYFLPTDLNVKYFVKYYWNLHESIGRLVDENEDKNKWL